MVYLLIKGSFRVLNIRSKPMPPCNAENCVKLTRQFQMCLEILISFNFVPMAFLPTQVLRVHTTLTLFQISYSPCSTDGSNPLIGKTSDSFSQNTITCLHVIQSKYLHLH